MKKKKISEKFFNKIIKDAITRLNNREVISHREFLQDIEKCLLEQLLERNKGHQTLTADMLSLREQTLRYRMKILGIESTNTQGRRYYEDE